MAIIFRSRTCADLLEIRSERRRDPLARTHSWAANGWPDEGYSQVGRFSTEPARRAAIAVDDAPPRGRFLRRSTPARRPRSRPTTSGRSCSESRPKAAFLESFCPHRRPGPVPIHDAHAVTSFEKEDEQVTAQWIVAELVPHESHESNQGPCDHRPAASRRTVARSVEDSARADLRQNSPAIEWSADASNDGGTGTMSPEARTTSNPLSAASATTRRVAGRTISSWKVAGSAPPSRRPQRYTRWGSKPVVGGERTDRLAGAAQSSEHVASISLRPARAVERRTIGGRRHRRRISSTPRVPRPPPTLHTSLVSGLRWIRPPGRRNWLLRRTHQSRPQGLSRPRRDPSGSR